MINIFTSCNVNISEVCVGVCMLLCVGVYVCLCVRGGWLLLLRTIKYLEKNYRSKRSCDCVILSQSSRGSRGLGDINC